MKVDKEEFCKDYVMYDNSYMCEKYGICVTTVWKYAKRFGVRRPDKYYKNVNVKNKNKIVWEEWMLEELDKYIRGEYKKEEIVEVLGLAYNTILVKMNDVSVASDVSVIG